MSEECEFYYYDGDFCCRLGKRKLDRSSVDSTTVHKYCWGYHYEDCPRYRDRYDYWDGDPLKKGNSESTSCFLTSACVEAMGLPDDCRELTVLRGFRDTFMISTEEGKKAVMEYYRIAPPIVDRIHQRSDSITVFERIYRELVLPCVALIDEGRKEEAFVLYRDYTLRLKEEYLSNLCGME